MAGEQRKAGIRRWISAICMMLCITLPIPADDEVEIVAGKSEDGSVLQLEFIAEAGAEYVVESSADMVSWQDDAIFQGLGSVVSWNLVELPRADGSTPISDGLPPGYLPPPQVSMHAQRISWDLGTVLRWNSLVDGTPMVHVLAGENLHSSMNPVTVLSGSGFHHFIQLGSELAADDIPYSDPLAAADAAMIADFTAALPALYQQVEDETDSDLNQPPAPLPDPNGARLFRVRREDVDRDGDGTPDHLEATQGTNWFTNDTDGDGISDDVDATPLDNDARVDPDGVGLPVDLETGLMARWDFESVAAGGFPAVPVWAGALVPQAGAGLAPFGGVVSHSVDMLDTGQTALVAPWALVNGHGVNTFAMWIKLPLNALLVNFFSDIDILGIGRSFGSGEVQSPMFRATISTSDTLRLESNWVNWPDPTLLAEWPLPAGLDDGEWHQLVIAKGPGIYQAYVDGLKLGTRVESDYIVFNLQFRPYFYIGQGDPVPDVLFPAGLRGQLDRFRLYSLVLSDEQVAALYDQDIDNDGLFDRTEGATAYWQDLNGNGQHDFSISFGPNLELLYSSEEETFEINPFRWDPPHADHDGDGVTSLDEQNIHQSDPTDPGDPGI